jgi:hypothetical protein
MRVCPVHFPDVSLDKRQFGDVKGGAVYFTAFIQKFLDGCFRDGNTE